MTTVLEEIFSTLVIFYLLEFLNFYKKLVLVTGVHDCNPNSSGGGDRRIAI
jgi:hypothetical protein